MMFGRELNSKMRWKEIQNNAKFHEKESPCYLVCKKDFQWSYPFYCLLLYKLQNSSLISGSYFHQIDAIFELADIVS
jgi:hypothetical protein